MESTKRCTYCAEEVLAAAIKCKHCGSDISATVNQLSLKPPLEAAVASDFVVHIPSRLEKSLAGLLDPQEIVQVKLKGVFKEALVCTDRRVLILKSGFMTGHVFGTNVFQSPYRNITSAQVNTHLFTGYFEISAGGVQNVATSYWASGKNSPQKRDNCISLNRRLFKAFQHAANFITARGA